LPDAFTPAWKPPRAPTNACTMEQIQDYYDACQGTAATTGTCDAFRRNIQNTNCIQCLITSDSRSTAGAIVRWSNGSVSANVAGCIALTEGNLTDSSCGARLFALYECENAACDVCSAGADDDALKACKTNADATSCSAYKSASDCAARADFDRCYFGDDFRYYFLGLGLFFCSSVDDAGMSGEGGEHDAAFE